MVFVLKSMQSRGGERFRARDVSLQGLPVVVGDAMLIERASRSMIPLQHPELDTPREECQVSIRLRRKDMERLLALAAIGSVE